MHLWRPRRGTPPGPGPGRAGKEITWIKKGGVYIAARNIISGVSWTDLYENGWVLGRELELDGRAYLCRLMEVGEKADRYSEYERLLAFVALEPSRTNSLSWGREQTGEKMAAVRGGHRLQELVLTALWQPKRRLRLVAYPGTAHAGSERRLHWPGH